MSEAHVRIYLFVCLSFGLDWKLEGKSTYPLVTCYCCSGSRVCALHWKKRNDDTGMPNKIFNTYLQNYPSSLHKMYIDYYFLHAHILNNIFDITSFGQEVMYVVRYRVQIYIYLPLLLWQLNNFNLDNRPKQPAKQEQK